MVLEVDVHDSSQSVALDPGFIWSAQNLKNFVKLVEFVVSFEKRLFSVKLSHDASKSKDVHRAVITVTFEKNLRGSVPSSGHVICVGWLGPDFSDQSKVSNFELFLIIKQNVLWFEIPVEIALLI